VVNLKGVVITHVSTFICN